MPDVSLFAAFLLTVLVLELTPGPNMAWLALLSARKGRWAGLFAVAGVALGLGTVGLAAALGVTAFIARNDMMFHALQIAGTGFMLYLAIEAWRESGESSPARMETGHAADFRRGFIINLLNPKAGLFFTALLPNYLDESRALAPQIALLTLTSVLIATAIHLALVFAGERAGHWLESGPASRLIRKGFAILLALIAVWLFAATRHG